MMKCLIVPHDNAATEINNLGGEDHNIMTIVEIQQKDIDDLWSIGILDELNDKLGLMIEEAEDESIVGKNSLLMAESIVNRYVIQHPDNKYLRIVHDLINEAFDKNTGLYIYL
jgi:CBS-domain-containing membrane protein